ncbi:MAG: HEAT repeat domain-containing protein, partial [Myxococcota bacterium]|nr:HEAT repeat domain-containing protein [Myxococcota bacterium]
MSPKVRALAARVVLAFPRGIADPVGATLVSLLHDTDARVRIGAALALGHLGYEPAVDPLVSMATGDDSPTAQFAAAEALASPWLRRVGYLARRLRAVDVSERLTAAIRLGTTDDLEAIDPLIEALGDSATSVRDAALQSLVQLGFMPVGYRNAIQDTGYARWMSRAELLAATGLPTDSASIDLYLGATQSSDARLVRGALEAATHLAVARTDVDRAPLTSAAIECLTSETWFIRHEAASALRQCQHIPKSPEDRAAYWLERGNADEVVALGKAAIAPLARALKTGGSSTRSLAAAVAVRLKAQDLIPGLTLALSDETIAVRTAAVTALHALGAFTPVLMDTLADPDPETRRLAAHALSGTLAGRQLLHASVAHEAEPVRFAIAEGLSTPLKGTHDDDIEALIALLKDESVAVRCQAAKTLGAYHEYASAHDALKATALHDTDARVRCASVDVLVTPSDTDTLVAALSDADRTVRQHARDALYEGGWQPKGDYAHAMAALAGEDWQQLAALGDSALQALEPVLRSTSLSPIAIERRLGALEALVAMKSPAALRYLERQLDDPSGDVRVVVIRALSQTEGALKKAITPTLIRFAEHDARADVRRAACAALGRIGGKVGKTLAAIERNDADATVRMAAAMALSAPSVCILEPLLERLQDEDLSTRLRSIEMLGRSQSLKAIDPLIGLLSDSNSVLRHAARTALGVLQWEPMGLRNSTLANGYARWLLRSEVVARVNGSDGASQTDLIRPLGHDTEANWRQAAIDTIAQSRVIALTGTCISGLDDTDEGVRRSAAIALQQLGYAFASDQERALYYVAIGRHADAASLGEVAEAPLVRALRTHAQDMDRANAGAALSQCSGAASEAALIEALHDPSTAIRINASYALGVRTADSAASSLAHLLHDTEPDVRSAAGIALTTCGESGLLALRDALVSDDVLRRREASRALGRMGADATAIAKDLVSALEHEGDALTRRRVATALGHIGGTSGVSELVSTLQVDPDDGVRAAAARALAYRGGTAVIPALCEALADADSEVRATALAGLYSLDWTPSDALGTALVAMVSGDFPAAAAAGATAVPLFQRVLADRSGDPDRVARRALAADAVPQL